MVSRKTTTQDGILHIYSVGVGPNLPEQSPR